MIRAVLDTNALVSAAVKPEGKPAQIFDRAGTRYELLCSDFIVQEVEGVLPRTHIQKKYTRLVTPRLQARFLADVRSLATMIGVHTTINMVEQDNKDNQVLACAVDGQADYLVTGDHHLLDIKTFRGIKVLTPAQFLDVLKQTRHITS